MLHGQESVPATLAATNVSLVETIVEVVNFAGPLTQETACFALPRSKVGVRPSLKSAVGTLTQFADVMAKLTVIVVWLPQRG